MPLLRAAVHVHTTRSFDGRWPLPALAAALRRRGYDAVLTAEHSQSLDPDTWAAYREECARASSPGFLVVPGVEYRDADNVVHVPTWGPLPHLGDRVDVGALLARVEELRGVAVWAHPGRRDAWDRFDPEWARLLRGVELWNRKYDGWRPPPRAAELAASWGLPGYASLDFHRRRQFFPLATRIEVAGPVTVEAVVAALRAGRVSPEFLRRPLRDWQSGLPRRLLDGAEAGRFVAARTARRLGAAI